MTDKTTKAKCSSCGNEWEIIGQIDNDFDVDTICPDCHYATSAWNFIDSYEEQEEE